MRFICRRPLSQRASFYILSHVRQKPSASHGSPWAALAQVSSESYAEVALAIRSKPRIPPEICCFAADFTPSYAIDYIDAYSEISTNTRFSRVLPPQLCYSSSALNTSVVLVGLW